MSVLEPIFSNVLTHTISRQNVDVYLYFYIVILNTAAFTYYDPAILQNKLTPLSIFRDLALRKRK